MIYLRQDEPGTVTVDVSKEYGFDISDDGAVLTTGLFIRETSDTEIIVADTGQLGQVVAFINGVLTDKGYRIDLDPVLSRVLRVFHDEQKFIKALRAKKIKQAPAVPKKLTGMKRELLTHQRLAVRHALTVLNAANFSVPGSGKTQSALAVYHTLRSQGLVDRLLVVGPASCFAPWEDEFDAVFGRPANSLRVIGKRSERAALLKEIADVDIILCTYQMASRERDSLAKVLTSGRYLFVLDESHHVKNIALGPWAKTAVELAPLAERRMILTGTPAPHSLYDLWSQFTFLWPSQAVMGTRSQFEQRIDGKRDPVRIIKREIDPFFIRTKKSDLDLPEPIPDVQKIAYHDIPERQRLIIRLLELRTLQEAKKLLDRTDVAILRHWRRARTLRFLQAASNPALLTTSLQNVGDYGAPLDDDAALAVLLRDYLKHEMPAKIGYVVKQVRQLVSEGQKVLIWATFIDNIHLLETLLKDLHPLKVYGGVPAYEEDQDPQFENRERNIRQFKTLSVEERPILIANAAACSESVSLHMVCKHAIYLERTFNCGQFLQSLDRIHRVGMPKNAPPTYHIPLLECAIEQLVDRRLRDRQTVLYRLLDDDMSVLGLDDESFLVEREDDLEEIFRELLKEIEASGNTSGNGTPGGSGAPV